MTTREGIDSFSLKDKVVVVTGGAGRYGKFIVEGLAEADATVYVASRDVQRCRTFAEELIGKGLKVKGEQLDQASEESIKRLFSLVLSKGKKIDILVNNAVLRPMKSYNDDIKSFSRSMDVNATGIFMMTRIFSENMLQRRAGSIINIASIQGVVGPNFSLYEGTSMDVPPDYFFIEPE